MDVVKKAVDLLTDYMHSSHRGAAPPRRGGVRAVPPDERTARSVLQYLDLFGYLKNSLAGWQDINIGDIVAAIKQFQGFFGVPRSGKVCAKTVRAMQAPRCGCPDVVRERHAATRRLKELAQANLPRWQKTGITYAIQDYLPGISKPDFEGVVLNSFQAWCRYANVDVQPARNAGQQVDIVISNGQGQQDNFDGPGGVLAWAYMPNGQDQQLLMKFDLDETWITNPAARGILVANVSCHEFGHLLGLDHSRLQSALMAPYYNAAVAVPQQQDDIPRLQARYGARQDPAPAPTDPQGPARVVSIRAQGPVTVDVNGQRVASA